MIDDPCPSCTGSGRVTRERTLSVNIPAGVEDGTRIRLAGEGEAGVRGGPAGDLYIFLSLGAHDFFQRDGADLHCRVPISMVQAALGGEFEAPTIDGGKTRVKVPEGTQSGRRFRLQGKGMPVLRSRQVGDMYVQIVVETPQKLTKKQRELLAEFERLSSRDTHPESTGFFGKREGPAQPRRLEHDPEKWEPVLRTRSCSTKGLPLDPGGHRPYANKAKWPEFRELDRCRCAPWKISSARSNGSFVSSSSSAERSAAGSGGGCATSSRRISTATNSASSEP